MRNTCCFNLFVLITIYCCVLQITIVVWYWSQVWCCLWWYWKMGLYLYLWCTLYYSCFIIQESVLCLWCALYHSYFVYRNQSYFSIEMLFFCFCTTIQIWVYCYQLFRVIANILQIVLVTMNRRIIRFWWCLMDFINNFCLFL